MYNGNPVKLVGEEEESILLSSFLGKLESIIDTNFGDTCGNEVLVVKNINKPIFTVLCILLGIDVLLFAVFLYYFLKIREKKKEKYANPGSMNQERLLLE